MNKLILKKGIAGFGMILLLLIFCFTGCIGGGENDMSQHPDQTQVGSNAISDSAPDDENQEVAAENRDATEKNGGGVKGNNVSDEAQIIPLSQMISKEIFPEQIKLSFYSEPEKISSQGYAKLTGVVTGKYNLALFSLGGESCSRKIGEKIGNYVLVKITKDEVMLKRYGVD